MNGLIRIGAIVAVSLISAIAYRKDRSRTYADNKSTRVKSVPSFRWIQMYLRLSTLIGGIAGVLQADPLGNLLLPRGSVFVGFFFMAIGLWLFIWSKKTLAECYSPCFDAFQPPRIVTSGPYAFIRHPIYTSNLMLVAGCALVSCSTLVALNVFVLGLYYFIAAVREEDDLRVAFAEYSAYVASTGRFIPRLFERNKG